MEANREGAEECLARALAALGKAPTDPTAAASALRFLQRAQRLYSSLPGLAEAFEGLPGNF